MSTDIYGARIELIDRVCGAVHDATESWEPGMIGVHLAYLVWEMAHPRGAVDWTTRDTRPILELFTSIFSESDPVWGYIDQPKKRHFIVVGRRPHCPEAPIVAHVVAHSAWYAVRKFGEGWLYDGEQLPPDWYEVGENPETKEPWMIIEGLVEINGEPISTIVDHEIDDL